LTVARRDISPRRFRSMHVAAGIRNDCRLDRLIPFTSLEPSS
jgi:hypothetical protein